MTSSRPSKPNRPHGSWTSNSYRPHTTRIGFRRRANTTQAMSRRPVRMQLVTVTMQRLARLTAVTIAGLGHLATRRPQ